MIPHIPIYTLLKKYDGETPYEGKIYKIRKLPKFLIFQLERFTKNNFFLEKNPTIVSFPLNNLDLKNCISSKLLFEKLYFFFHFIDIDLDLQINPKTKYNLLANICHEGKPKGGFYKIHVKHKALNQWYHIYIFKNKIMRNEIFFRFEIQDLHITPVMPQLVCLSEAYIQIYELQSNE